MGIGRMTTAEVLRAAKAKIAARKNWCKGTQAKNSRGDGVPARHPDACKWCVEGALRFVTHGQGQPFIDSLRLMSSAVGTDVHVFNDRDGRKHSEIMEAFDKAIALAEGGGE